jgi:hypothetical protein
METSFVLWAGGAIIVILALAILYATIREA